MQKDDTTWLNICYIGFALLMTYVSYQLFETVGFRANLDGFNWFEQGCFFASVAAGLGSTVWLRGDPERKEYHLATIGEVRKVSWPTIPATKQMTAIVFVVVAIFSVILSVFDLIWSKILQAIL